MILPAISVRQPWAEAIISCGKNIENCSWPCPARYFGRVLLIHAGKTIDFDGNLSFHPELSGIKSPLVFKRGGIVGAMFISGCEENNPSRWADPLCFHWLISRAWRVPFYACKGRLGFFQVDYPFGVDAA
jgi:hypothetical protein